VLRALSGCRGLAINWLIVGIVGLRYLRSRDTRENGIVRAGPSLISLCGHHIRPHRFGLVAPAFPRVFAPRAKRNRAIRQIAAGRSSGRTTTLRLGNEAAHS